MVRPFERRNLRILSSDHATFWNVSRDTGSDGEENEAVNRAEWYIESSLRISRHSLQT